MLGALILQQTFDLTRVLKEQCNLTDDKDNPVELKAPKEIASDSLQNPSDPDATYSGHKGQKILLPAFYK